MHTFVRILDDTCGVSTSRHSTVWCQQVTTSDPQTAFTCLKHTLSRTSSTPPPPAPRPPLPNHFLRSCRGMEHSTNQAGRRTPSPRLRSDGRRDDANLLNKHGGIDVSAEAERGRESHRGRLSPSSSSAAMARKISGRSGVPDTAVHARKPGVHPFLGSGGAVRYRGIVCLLLEENRGPSPACPRFQ